MAAMPGSVNVACSSESSATRNSRFTPSATDETTPKAGARTFSWNFKTDDGVDAGTGHFMYRVVIDGKATTGMAVRAADQEWKRTLNRLIMENQPEINKLLICYNIPILDEANVPITAETLSKRP